MSIIKKTLFLIKITHSRSPDSPPCLKLISKSFGNIDKIKMEYLRLNLPVTFNDEFLTRYLFLNCYFSPLIKISIRSIINERRMNALNIYKSQLEEEAESKEFID